MFNYGSKPTYERVVDTCGIHSGGGSTVESTSSDARDNVQELVDRVRRVAHRIPCGIFGEPYDKKLVLEATNLIQNSLHLDESNTELRKHFLRLLEITNGSNRDGAQTIRVFATTGLEFLA